MYDTDVRIVIWVLHSNALPYHPLKGIFHFSHTNSTHGLRVWHVSRTMIDPNQILENVML
jgi:hypothetical protein